jgi:hypothetical protein
MTVEAVVRKVAARYCLPYIIGRGYSSLPPRKEMFERYKRSGKDKLVILFLTDHDPEGCDIPESFANSLQQDFGVSKVVPIKVALKPEQIRTLRLRPNTDAKKGSSRYKRFVERYGPAAYELEAVHPTLHEKWLDEAVRSVLDIRLFNAQVELEKQDARAVAAYKQEALGYLKMVDFDETGP